MKPRQLPDTPLRFCRNADEAFQTAQYANAIEPPPRRSKSAIGWMVLFVIFAALCLYHISGWR